jgi:hypothetical protein
MATAALLTLVAGRGPHRGGFDVARLSHVRDDARMDAVLATLEAWTETREDAGGVNDQRGPAARSGCKLKPAACATA